MIVTRGFGLGKYCSIVAGGYAALKLALERATKAAGYVFTMAHDLYVKVAPNTTAVNRRV